MAVHGLIIPIVTNNYSCVLFAVVDILRRKWSNKAQTLARLQDTLAESPSDGASQHGMLELLRFGYLVSTDDHVELTLQGQQIRDAIEVETDRVFFASWNHQIDAECFQ
jgi:hypothetical protein